MKLPSLNSLVSGLLAFASALILASCGGGGGAGNPTIPGGALQIQPATATIYAGVPQPFTITGGRKPYALSTNEPILPVPSSINSNTVVLLGMNPGVIDAGLQPGELPVRTVNFTVRSGDGQTLTVPVKVAQNFLTGYGVSFAPSACPQDTSGVTPPTDGSAFACGGGETAVRFAATTNGALHGDELFNLYVLRGNAIFVDPATGANGQMISVRSDHTGEVLAILRTSPNQPAQIGVIRVQEASTGVYADTAFVISGGGTATTLTALPDTFTFTGATTADCGTGSGTFQVFDGVPPYTAVSANSNLVGVTPSTSSSQPGTFRINAANSGLCGDTTIIVTDSVGARATITVTTAAGTETPPTPPTPIVISPASITLSCGQTGSVSIAGGGSGGTAPTYSASTTDPNLSVTVTGATLSVSRLGVAPPTGANANTTVTVTDGSTFSTLTVTSPSSCS